jgi:hypothetical protein
VTGASIPGGAKDRERLGGIVLIRVGHTEQIAKLLAGVSSFLIVVEESD